MKSSVNVQNTSSHSITASKVIVILPIHRAQNLLNSFHFKRKKSSFLNKRKSDVTTAVLVQMKSNQQHLLGFWCSFPEIMLDPINICRPHTLVLLNSCLPFTKVCQIAGHRLVHTV